MVVWYEILSAVNLKREIRRKRHFDENPSDASEVTSQSVEESFRVNYFLCVVDHAISSLRRRFEQYQEYENVFGFLFTSDKLRSLDNACLKSSCLNFEIALKNHDRSDVDGNDLYVELKLLQEFLPHEKMGHLDILEYLKHLYCFHNAIIAYRVLLTIPGPGKIGTTLRSLHGSLQVTQFKFILQTLVHPSTYRYFLPASVDNRAGSLSLFLPMASPPPQLNKADIEAIVTADSTALNTAYANLATQIATIINEQNRSFRRKAPEEEKVLLDIADEEIVPPIITKPPQEVIPIELLHEPNLVVTESKFSEPDLTPVINVDDETIEGFIELPKSLKVNNVDVDPALLRPDEMIMIL
ncbi:hypothetical protein OSB04_019270 [Centaurea solstitialis]|uniref:Uncharacterized protein n=1 Tax=Centaurea solstitialis TaxID=347529 RepID=A0AA38W2Q4_9ASTR|nr:hypothetical protein OSB04_019270 [Centaurea solstitialis]